MLAQAIVFVRKGAKQTGGLRHGHFILPFEAGSVTLAVAATNESAAG